MQQSLEVVAKNAIISPAFNGAERWPYRHTCKAEDLWLLQTALSVAEQDSPIARLQIPHTIHLSAGSTEISIEASKKVDDLTNRNGGKVEVYGRGGDILVVKITQFELVLMSRSGDWLQVIKLLPGAYASPQHFRYRENILIQSILLLLVCIITCKP